MIFCAAILGFLAVAAGAFGAHALKDKLTPQLLQVFEVGVRYQMYHALALLALGVWQLHAQVPYSTAIASCFILGTLLFSGSLFALCLTGMNALGAITPIGGTLLLIGWGLLAWAAWQ